MTRIARILRSRGFRTALILPIVVVTFVMVTIDTAKACWLTILQECFSDHTTPQWPWDPPGEGRWWECSVVGSTTYCWPNIPSSVSRWGLHNSNYYDVLICPEDDHSLWCYGYPPNHDPEFDIYPANYDTYVLFGPFSLATATAAECVFRMFNESEPVHDSLFWGASVQYPLTNALMKIGGTTSFDTPNGWETRSMDLNQLVDFQTGDTVSMLGQSTVYVWWRFRSDGNSVRNVGSFIDNVVIAKDDGQMDLAVYPPLNSIELLHPDTSFITEPLELHDTLMARYGWSVCEGGVDVYDSFRVMLTLSGPLSEEVLVDTLVLADTSGTVVQLYSPPWILTPQRGWGEFIVRLTVDTLNNIVESSEANNIDTTAYVVLPPNPPPIFYWIAPGNDTLFADRQNGTVTLRWFLSDPEEPAWLNIYFGNSPGACNGTPVPGGQAIESIEAEDSLVWDIHGLVSNRTYWIYGEYYDSENDTCVRAVGPMRTCDGCLPVGPRPAALPEAFFLEQNYPNPFNPLTEIRYGIAVPGNVMLRVYDLLGREKATLVDMAQSPGVYSVSFDGSTLGSGLYLYVLTTPEGKIARKMMLLK